MKPIPVWRQIQRQNFTRLDQLASFLELSDSERSQLLDRSNFPLNLPVRLAGKIAKRTLDDPILRQFIPHQDELKSSDEYFSDPVGDRSALLAPKLLQKYRGRALLLASSACAMHCRFCFRQNFPYETAQPDYSEELQIIAADPTIHEIILSGGDPLSLSNESLQSLFASLAAIPHVRRLRFHTRFPVGIPERIDEGFLSLLKSHTQQIILIVHINHPLEIDADLLAAFRPIQRLGIPILSQSVLLKGVNDDESILLTLCETLTNAGILPYYLHLLDRVSGSAHFEVSAERGKELIDYLQGHLSGYGVPRFVREIAGCLSKTNI